jgi:hypothetical protein
MKKSRKRGKRKKPFRYINILTDSIDGGSRAINNQWPSSGGMGNILNIPRTRFIITMVEKRLGIKGEMNISGIKRRLKPNSRARIKFEAGPANATFDGPNLRSLKLFGL